MDEFVSTFIASVNSEGLWATLGACVPLIALSILFGLGVFCTARVLYGIFSMRFGL